MSTASRDAAGPGSQAADPSAICLPEVEERGWGPTLLLCAVVLLSALIVVVAKPLTAGASPTRSHAHAAIVRHAEKVSKVAPGVATSPNWSGYVAYAPLGNNGGFNQVSAQWTEPAVTCPKKDAWTLFWVGFDGWPSTEPSMERSVEQGGTSAQCVNGVPRYKAFYEMWPSDAVQTTFAVNAGDQIFASVVYSPTTYSFTTPFQITVTDVTTGHSLAQLEPCGPGLDCARTSAEWIAESPAHYGSKTTTWFPLADYGTVNFTDAQATNVLGDSGPISAPQWWDSSGIERIAGRSKPLAKVSTLESEYSGSASAFSDTWQRK